MLENPVVIGRAALEMSDDLREIVFPERRSPALASDSHDAAGRTPQILPVAV
jgi:hypothetical protein